MAYELAPGGGFVLGALSGLFRRRAQEKQRHLAEDDRQRLQADADARNAVTEWNALTNSPRFQTYDADTQAAFANQFKSRAGTRYAGRIFAPGDVLGSSVDAAMVNGQMETVPGSERKIRVPAYTAPPIVARPLDPSVIARNQAQTEAAQTTTAKNNQTMQLAAPAALADYTAKLPLLADSVYGLPKDQQREAIAGYNTGGANLPGFKSVPYPGEQIGTNNVPRPVVEGPRPDGQLGPGLPIADPRGPKQFPIYAQLPISAGFRKQLSDTEAERVKQASDDLFKSREQKERERHNKESERLLGSGQAVTLNGQTLSARTAAANRAQSASQFEQGQAATESRFVRSMAAKPAPGQITPSQMFTQTHSDRVRQQGQVDKLADLRTKAQKRANQAEAMLASGINPNAEPRRDKKAGAINPEDANGVKLTEGEKAEARRVFREAEDTVAGYDEQIKQIKKGMPQMPGAQPRGSDGRFQARPKPKAGGKQTGWHNGAEYTIERVA